MKKVLFIMVLVMSAVVVNAQVQTPSDRMPGSADSTSTWSKSSGTTIPTSDLPQAVTDNIKKDYPGYTIKSASSMTGKNGLNYVVDVMKGTESESLVFDNTGKFLKKLTSKSGMHDMDKK
jgi:hypothetical protein